MRIVVIGIGNPLMGDDGFGIKVIDKLKGKVPSFVELYKLENLSFQILDILEKSNVAIIVDIVKSNGNPGDIYIFDIEECRYNPRIISLHDMDIVNIINVGKLVYDLPKKL
ncbi:MAG TPA: hydrogenase maturation protease [Archaeoglobus profundus]|nr:hydrogenase maturation protease [Archaeoglobus profundus]